MWLPSRCTLLFLCMLGLCCSAEQHEVDDAGADAAWFDVAAVPPGFGIDASAFDASSGLDASRAAAAPPGDAPPDAAAPEASDSAMQPPLDAGADAGDTAATDDASPHESTSDEDAGESASDAAPPRMDCQGKPGAPGDSVRMYGERQYIVHIPQDVHPNTALPVVFVVHGAGGTGEQMQTATAFDVYADQDGVVAVYPDGGDPNSPWNVGRGACAPGGLISNGNDDFAYFEAMLDAIEQDQCLDREHVFVTGFSMGGYFSHHIGCQRGGDLVRAVAPHSGGTYAGDCPGAPLPVLLLHGNADPLIDFACAQSARERWVERNGCDSDFDVVDIVGGHCEWHLGCPQDGQVVLCEFEELEHSWGYPPDYAFSTELIWQFFRAYL